MNAGKLIQKNERYTLQFEQEFLVSPQQVFERITNPVTFTQWYPFATEEMDVKVGGKLKFDDGEGNIYEGEIIELEAPYTFVFKEVDDLLDIRVTEQDNGCLFRFQNTFDDASMAISMAAGWHRCLEVFEQLVKGEQIEWKENAESLRQYYKRAFENLSE
ncbi:SRPBCC domain-containing protein [Gracilibacillus sp. S3-1-1]|uniref:SRPBCC domain-containing protein n=1 Tax=Gracilibacillus pellucidus TaxID=3095368 RepID=A0ACC6M0F1_9BACI|nr:SRPBCC domain-containing protein [Gracilibacillus sp. S3-1-1]MDX8044419.1 SRPBCC domain-containing protein [Gracilibacillus sp. S3-1-1]